jgi:hypothetical protein
MVKTQIHGHAPSREAIRVFNENFFCDRFDRRWQHTWRGETSARQRSTSVQPMVQPSPWNPVDGHGLRTGRKARCGGACGRVRGAAGPRRRA